MRTWRLPWLTVVVVWLECGLYWPHMPTYISNPIWPGMLLWRRHWAILFPGLTATLTVVLMGMVQELVASSKHQRLLWVLGWVGGILGLFIGFRTWIFFSHHLKTGHPVPLDFHSLALVSSVLVLMWTLDLIALPNSNIGPALALAAAGLFLLDYVWHGIDSLSVGALSVIIVGVIHRRIPARHISQAPDASH